MSSKHIETQLDRSLRHQVPLPKLDERFNAAVWDRIAKLEAPAVAPPARGARWLLASNLVGAGVSVALIVYVVVRAATGLDVDVAVNVPMPEISDQTLAAAQNLLGWGVAAAAVAFGFAFTGTGRRLLQQLRAEFS